MRLFNLSHVTDISFSCRKRKSNSNESHTHTLQKDRSRKNIGRLKVCIDYISTAKEALICEEKEL